MCGDRCRGELEAVDPIRQNDGEGVVLTRDVPCVLGRIINTALERFQADVQRKIVKGAQRAGVGDSPFPNKRRIACSLGPFERVNGVNNLTIQSDERVITSLVFIHRMRCLECVKC